MSEIALLKSVTRDPAIVAASLAANLLALAVPIAMLQIYDRVIPNAAHETLFVLAAMVVAALLVDCVLRISRARLLAYFAARFERGAYHRAVWALIMDDPGARERIDNGTLGTRLSAIDRLRSQRADGAASALLDLPFAFVFLAIMAMLSPIVALAVALMLAVSFLLLRRVRRRAIAMRKERLETEARRYSFIGEVLGGIRSVRALRIGAQLKRRQERLLGRSAKLTQHVTRDTHAAQGLTVAIGNVMPVVTAATAGYLVLSGEASIGVLAAVVVLSGRVVQPVLRVEGYLSNLDSARQAEKDLRALIDVPMRRSGTQPLDRIHEIRFRGVTAAREPDFSIGPRDINLTLKRGDCLHLRGKDPVALSAAARMFVGELPVESGEIIVNGKSIDSYQFKDRQCRIRLLSEEAQLLDGTLFDNICAFQPERYREKALSLADTLGLQTVLHKSARGLQTRVRSHSAGLPQSAVRIATNIAALVTEPDIVVFQMANSGLDMEMDRRLLEWLKTRAPDHILILVSNRPSYVALATQSLDISAERAEPGRED